MPRPILHSMLIKIYIYNGLLIIFIEKVIRQAEKGNNKSNTESANGTNEQVCARAMVVLW